jgi:chemotaxis protein histidine kinase CheA
MTGDDLTPSAAVIDEDQFAVDDELLEIFRAEAEELLSRISENLELLAQNPSDRDPFWEIRRSAHTFKGAAGLAGQKEASKTAHRVEDLFDRLAEHDSVPDRNTIEIICRAAEILSLRINEEHGHLLDRKTEQLYMDIDSQLVLLTSNQSGPNPSIPVANSSAFQPTKQPRSAPPPNSKKVSRVSLERIDELAQIGQQIFDLQHGFDQGFEQLSGYPANDAVTDLSAQIENLRNLAKTLREKILRVRMIAFGTLVPRLNRSVYVTAEEEGKQAELIIENGQQELDTEILDFLAEPLLHLLKNAVVHGIEKPETRQLLDKPEMGAIKIAVASDQTHIILKISDDGSGISVEKLRSKALASNILLQDVAAKMTDDEIRQFIFIPGLSTAAELNMNAGRGVGMSIVKESVESRSGTISVDSVPGKGSEFTIRIPHASPFSHIISETTADNFDVLIVDDSPTIRALTTGIVHKAGWTTTEAVDGRQALEILASTPKLPSVILTDLEMPNMDGFEFLSELKENKNFSSIPVVMITSRTDEHYSTRAFELGAAAFLTKPVVGLRLVDVVRDLVG